MSIIAAAGIPAILSSGPEPANIVLAAVAFVVGTGLVAAFIWVLSQGSKVSTAVAAAVAAVLMAGPAYVLISYRGAAVEATLDALAEHYDAPGLTDAGAGAIPDAGRTRDVAKPLAVGDTLYADYKIIADADQRLTVMVPSGQGVYVELSTAGSQR